MGDSNADAVEAFELLGRDENTENKKNQDLSTSNRAVSHSCEDRSKSITTVQDDDVEDWTLA